ncbi:hypothetical protein FOPG_19424 [Fusarium oxysporum f. sp. conglutinans race 2 54008]|uniref:Uncharacterized protein n=1 Tax=Fusarium oxysporum f. sp. conglutinans race 2 54008 TaxID=1089457 RepID=X0HT28_FUSOX|nr:hypothetical protein FOPG_19424 [Fusarium oxysporum f. sp. conglutinans race 2 54008]
MCAKRCTRNMAQSCASRLRCSSLVMRLNCHSYIIAPPTSRSTTSQDPQARLRLYSICRATRCMRDIARLPRRPTASPIYKRWNLWWMPSSAIGFPGWKTSSLPQTRQRQ